MIESNKQVIGRGAAYIYIQYFVSAISGYIFWLILTQLTSSSIVGTLSAIIAASEILTSFAIIGVPDSIQRYLGKSFYEKNAESAKKYLAAAFILVSLGIFATSLFIIFDNTFFNLSEINNLKLLIITIVTSSTVNLLLTSIVIASLKTRVLPTVNIISSSSKIILSIFLVLSGSGVVGISLSYLVFGNVLSAILLTIYSKSLFRPTSKVQTKSTIGLRHASKDLLAGGVASWIPMIVMNIGIQLGTLVLFESKGSDDTAIYFISLTIVNALLVGTVSLATIGLPVLSAIQDGRKRLAWQTLRWGYLISVPLASAIFFYSQEILNLLGQNYTEGATALQILLLSIPPTIIHSGISNLIYSYGNYKQSIAFDSSMGIPRIILYFILVPIYGLVGVSVAFTLGSLAGLIISIIVARKIGMLIFWKDLVLVLIVPIVIGYILYSFEINFVLGIIATIIASYISLLKLKVITKSDIQDITEILPVNMSNQLSKFLRKIKRD